MVLFDASRNRHRVRFALWMGLTGAVAMLVFAVLAVTSYGLHPSEGGALAPLWARLALGGAAGVGGAALLVYFGAFTRRYVLRIEALGAERLAFTTVGFVGPRRFEVSRSEVAPAGFHDGAYDNGQIRGMAPYYALRVAGRRLPLVLDLHAETPDRLAFYALVGEDNPFLLAQAGQPPWTGRRAIR